MTQSAPEVMEISVEKDAQKRKRVLLVDGRAERREVRSEMMRKLGIEVDGAPDIHEARLFWQPHVYDLVLLHVENEPMGRDTFCTLMRSASPDQQISFLVGKPAYLADLPNDGEVAEVTDEGMDSQSAEELSLERPSETWGILEACRQISAVRSKANARMRALRGQPAPRRDSENSPSRIRKPGMRKRDSELTADTVTKWIFG